jgi:hypothetical protein
MTIIMIIIIIIIMIIMIIIIIIIIYKYYINGVPPDSFIWLYVVCKKGQI